MQQTDQSELGDSAQDTPHLWLTFPSFVSKKNARVCACPMHAPGHEGLSPKPSITTCYHQLAKMGRQDEPAFLASPPVPGSTGKLVDGTDPNVALKSDGSTTAEGEPPNNCHAPALHVHMYIY